MNQANQNHNIETQASISRKRKRGRPRKDMGSVRGQGSNTPMPPWSGTTANQASRHDGQIDESDAMVGQLVSGIVEAVFDDGFLLTVNVSNSGEALTGVVFKPGHCLPISPENDVAPEVQMIKRNQRMVLHENGASQLPEAPHQVSNTSEKQITAAMTTTMMAEQVVGSRGTVLPVVLRPVCLSNGIVLGPDLVPEATTPTQKPAHLAAAERGRSVHLSNGLAPVKPLLTPQPQVRTGDRDVGNRGHDQMLVEPVQPGIKEECS